MNTWNYLKTYGPLGHPKARRIHKQANQGKRFKRLQAKGSKYATKMRRNPTRAERIMASWLKSFKIKHVQQPFFTDGKKLFIPDFRISTRFHKVLIEVDGSSHDGKESYDAYRTQWLEKNRKCKVIRFTNDQVINDMPEVMNQIMKLEPIFVG